MGDDPVTYRVILITGASSGIGYESALAFVRRGDKVAATARRQDRLDQLASAAKSLPGEICTFAADVTNPQDLERTVDAVAAKWGRLDVLVANAGLGQRGSIVESAWDDLEAVLRTNIDGVLHSVRAAVPLMRKSGGGHIIIVSSVTSVATTPYATVYAASKSAVNAIARGLRTELRRDNIWVTTILLGQTHSEFAEKRLGISGRVAKSVPTMTAEYVARRIVHESSRRHRSVVLRPLDRLLILGGAFLPQVMDRIMARIYRHG